MCLCGDSGGIGFRALFVPARLGERLPDSKDQQRMEDPRRKAGINLVCVKHSVCNLIAQVEASRIGIERQKMQCKFRPQRIANFI